jgi:hypothetical protein
MPPVVPSSPLSSPPRTQAQSQEVLLSQEAKHQYRPNKALPLELAEHVRNYIEEGLLTQAFNLLLSITGNTTSSSNRNGPVTIPSPSHLALAATVAVHPHFTTRTAERETWNQANSALRLLKLVHTRVGPIQGNLGTAFAFRKFSTSINQARNEDSDEDSYETDHDLLDASNLKMKYVQRQSLWTRADDFWSFVGWAFNCASLPSTHGGRWKHYSLLLDFMITVLETDWQLRTTGIEDSPEESLLWQYIELAQGGTARQRRILRAIFADWTTKSMREFKEIFHNELKGPKKDQPTEQKREVVDIDHDEYGDYLIRDESDVSDDNINMDGTSAQGRPAKRLRTHSRSRTSSRVVTPRSSAGSLRSAHTDGEKDASMASTLGDTTSINLRLRLLALLAEVSSHPTLLATSPTTFPDLDDLLTLYVEFICPLPLPVFTRVMLPSLNNPLSTNLMIKLCERMLERTLEHLPKQSEEMTQEILVEEYLPFTSSKNSADANARISICLESLVHCLTTTCVLYHTKDLIDAMETGIEKRTNKAQNSKKSMAEDITLLSESSDRLRMRIPS